MASEHNADIIYSHVDNLLNGCHNKSPAEEKISLTTIRDVEMLLLIGQYLREKGLTESCAELSKESGIILEDAGVTKLKSAILDGRWTDAETAVRRLAPVIGDPERVDEIRFLLLEQKFLEHLEANEIVEAVALLRNRITPMQRNMNKVHALASCLMCSTPGELRAHANGWAGTNSRSRLQLIDRIQVHIPAEIMLPPNRLEVLINEAVRSQLSACLFHNPSPGKLTRWDNNTSLFQQHFCGMLDFPISCVQILDQTNNEFECCQFSPDGLYLATGGKDEDVNVWRVDHLRHTVSEFKILSTPAQIVCLHWSPDSRKLAVCCGKEKHSTVLVFDVLTEHRLCEQKVNDEDWYSTAAFFPDSRKLAFGGLKGAFHIMDTEDQGKILASVEGYRVQCMVAVHSHPPVPVPDAQTKSIPNPLDTFLPEDPNSESFTGDIMNVDSCIGDPLLTDADSRTDKLLIADSLHRIRLFRFGFRGSDSTDRIGLCQRGRPAPESSGAVAGSRPSSTINLALSLNPSVTSVPAGILLGVPILPDGLGRVSQLHSRSPQSLRQVLQHSGAGGISTTHRALISSTGGISLPGVVSEDGVTGTGSSVTVLFGTPLDSSNPESISALAEMRAITAAATAAALTGPNSSSFASLVHSLTSRASVASGTSVESSTTTGPRTNRPSVSGIAEPAVDPVVCLTSTRVIPTVSSSGPTLTRRMTTVTSASGLAGSANSANSSTTSLRTPVTGNETINGYTLLDHRTLFREAHAIQSMVISRCSQRVLITGQKIGLHLWDLEACTMVQRFTGCKHETSRLSTTFGGINDNFVAAGVENGRVHVWHVRNGNHPIYSTTLSSSAGPGDVLVCVHWNPVLPTMMATVSNAGELCIWGPQRSTSVLGQTVG